MATLNLVDPSQSDISYKISRFPDGQQNVVLESRSVDKFHEVCIKARLNNWRDLELIVCTVACLRECGLQHISLYVPYIVGARSDRKFETGGNNYVRDVIAPVINSLGFFRVTCLDPHSDVLEACIKNFRKQDNSYLVRFSLSKIDNKDGAQSRVALISPDAGALKKIYDVAKYFTISNVTTASKVRDIQTGNIVRTELPTMDLDGIEHFVIIDDICDGGRTFIELAKEIRKQTDKPIYLIVSHGIFSAGFDELSKHFKGVFCTNSYSEISHPLVSQLNVF